MALGTLHPRMFSAESKSRLGMIKLCGIELHRSGIPSQMIFVTFNALFGNHGIMKSVPAVAQAGDFLMTAETFVTANRFADIMALCTIR